MDKELNEAICNLKELVENKDKYIKYHSWVGTKVFENIETVLNRLEEYSKQLDLDYVDNNYISKKKIEKKIEELKKQSGGNVFHIQQTINAEIILLKELLEE